jgi:hypothetical protein
MLQKGQQGGPELTYLQQEAPRVITSAVQSKGASDADLLAAQQRMPRF